MKKSAISRPLPLPNHYDPARVGEIWRVPYQERAQAAQAWSLQHDIHPASEDRYKTALVAIDVQNTFCIPEFELFVGGRSGMGAVEDNRRLCEFIYRNLNILTRIAATLDTHTAMQIFHPIFLVDANGAHPAPMTQVSLEDVLSGRWAFNPAIASTLHISPEYGRQHLLHYVEELKQRGKYELTVWPYHVMLGSIGHALVPAVEEAVFFHTVARSSQTDFQIKGSNPLTEHYSAVGPEVLDGPRGETIARKNAAFLRELHRFDRIIIAGQAKSHCVAWTIDDLLVDIRASNPELVNKVYLLEDCTSPVVIPDVVDFTDAADAAFERFRAAGMHVVRSTDPIETWN